MNKKHVALLVPLALILVFTMTGTAFATKTNASPFTDMDKHWAKDTIQCGYEKGITKGYGDGTFKPNEKVTEGEFIAMLIRAFNPKDFRHIPKDKMKHWADSYYRYAGLKNYPVNGLEDKHEERGKKVTRKQVAEIVAGTQGKNYIGDDAIHYILSEGLAQGRQANEISIASYEGDSQLTRAEALQFIRVLLNKGVKDEDGKAAMKERPEAESDKATLKPLPKPSPKPEKPVEKPTVDCPTCPGNGGNTSGKVEPPKGDKPSSERIQTTENADHGKFGEIAKMLDEKIDKRYVIGYADTELSLFNGKMSINNLMIDYEPSELAYTTSMYYNLINVWYANETETLELTKSFFELLGATETENFIADIKHVHQNQKEIKRQYGPYETYISGDPNNKNHIAIHFK